MGHLAFLQVPVKGWVIYVDEYGLLDGPDDAMCLPVHNGETVHIDWVSCDLAVMVNGEQGSEMFPCSCVIKPSDSYFANCVII